MLYEIMKRINNFFIVESGRKTWTIEDGKIALPFVQENQYFKITGSTFNDGVYKYADDMQLTDETFNGVISAMAVPQSFLGLVDEIEEWQKSNSKTITSPYSNESFSDYSYSINTNLASNSGSISWYSVFSDRLSIYKKV